MLSFLELVRYYRRFISRCSGNAKPLTALSKPFPFKYSPAVDFASYELKESFTKAISLVMFSPKKETFVTSDASKFDIGAVHEQKGDSRFHTVEYARWTLNDAKQNYEAHTRKLLVVVGSIQKCRVYLHGISFTAYTDHYPLEFLKTQKSLCPGQVF